MLKGCLRHEIVGAQTNQICSRRAQGIKADPYAGILPGEKRIGQAGHLIPRVRNVVSVVENSNAETVCKAARYTVQSDSVGGVVVLVGKGLERNSSEAR